MTDEYQLVLHDIKGVNLTVGFFLDTETFLYSHRFRACLLLKAT